MRHPRLKMTMPLGEGCPSFSPLTGWLRMSGLTLCAIMSQSIFLTCRSQTSFLSPEVRSRAMCSVENLQVSLPRGVFFNTFGHFWVGCDTRFSPGCDVCCAPTFAWTDENHFCLGPVCPPPPLGDRPAAPRPCPPDDRNPALPARAITLRIKFAAAQCHAILVEWRPPPRLYSHVTPNFP